MTTEHEPLDLDAQERTTAKAAEEERLAREKEQNDLRFVLGSKQGRRFMYRLLSGTGLYRLSMSLGNTDPLLTAFNEGQRNVGLQMLSEITEACPERYTEMLAEQKEAKEKHDNRNADRRNARPRR